MMMDCKAPWLWTSTSSRHIFNNAQNLIAEQCRNVCQVSTESSWQMLLL